MVVVFEFLDTEPIENVITCMHFKVDKVVYFGYHDTIQDKKESTESFLKKYCGVQSVVFHPLSEHDLQSVLKSMRKEIEYEIGRRAKVFFDITGGEDLILVAFGMLCREYRLAMHRYDIPSNKLIELDTGDDNGAICISEGVGIQHVVLDLDRLIELKGGKINYNRQKSYKRDGDQEFSSDVAKIWKVASKYADYWNPFSEFLRNNMEPDANLQVVRRLNMVLSALEASETKLKTISRLNKIIDDLTSEGILRDTSHVGGKYQFRFKNQNVKDCIWESGSLLEIHTYQKEKMTSTDCRVGVHLDWDGQLNDKPGSDVLNEIDVLSLDGNIPTFISCKSGKMGSQQALHALYELETVTRRFGGKYARKKLVLAKELSRIYMERAEEMGIEICVE